MTRRAAANLFIQLDPRARVGLQEQLYAGIRRAIVAGVVRPGTRVPSSRALADELGVSRTTTQLALDQLRAEGYLVMRRGSGTFVGADLPDDAPPRGAEARPPVRERPPLSTRGTALAQMIPGARRIVGPARAFRIGAPALEHFPVRLWSQLASRAALSVRATQLDYGGSGGLRALREAIAEHARTSRGARCDARQVIVVGGAQRGLDFLCRMLLDPGDRALVEEPGYPGAWSALVGAGATIVPAAVDQEGLSIAACYGQEGARLAYVTPSHQFPLGVPMTLSRRMALLNWASAAGAWVVEDDYDSEFRHGARPVPCLQGLDGDGRVIYVGSFSKSLCPAVRLGFLIVPPGLQDRLLAARVAGADSQPPFLEQAVLADFMAGGHFARHLRRMRAIYRERLEALADAIRREAAGALRLRPVQTGLHAIADLESASAWQVFDEAMARGVEVMPLAAYARGQTAMPEALVLGFGAVGPERLLRGTRALVGAIEAVQRRGRSSELRRAQVAR